MSKIKKMINNNILIKVDTNKEKTTSGIIIPQTAKDPKTIVRTGTVMSVGEGRLLSNGQIIKPIVKVGDRVMWHKHNGKVELEEGEVLYIIVSEEMIIGIITED